MKNFITIIQKFKYLLKGKEAKVLLENFISLSSLQLVGMVLPLITLPYILRVLGFENYGIIVFSSTLIAYFTSLTDFSFKLTATRDVAISKHSKIKLSYIYSKVMIIKGLFLSLSFLIITLIVFNYKPFYENRIIYFLTAPILLGHALFPDWFFQGIEKMKYITFLNIGVKLFFTLCVFVFIQKESDYWIYPLLQSLGFLIAGLVGQFILIYKYKLKFVWIKYQVLFQTIKFNIPIFINQFIPNLYNNTSVFLLGILTNNSMVGIYNAIQIVVNLCISLIEILSRVFFPHLNRRYGSFSKYEKLMIFVSIILICISLMSHKIVFWYLNIDQNNAFLILTVLASGLMGYTLYNIYGVNYFIIKRQDRIVMKNTIISSLIGFILAFPLIYYFGIIGAALNLSISRWLMGLGLFVQYKKISKN